MLIYLANYTCPDIVHTVHACTHYTHNPKQTHATVVKHILRHFKGMMGQGMTLEPNNKHELECFLDNDFASNYNSCHDRGTTSNKSCTGYTILYQGCPTVWTPKLQTQCGPSSAESEYLALSQSMRDILRLREILKEVMDLVLNQDKLMPK